MLGLFYTNIAYADAVDNFVGNVDRLIINPIIYVLFALAVLYFLYGVFEFLSNQENEEKKTTGKRHMIWGIIGMVIMVSVWAILGFMANALGVGGYIHPGNPSVSGTVTNLPKIK